MNILITGGAGYIGSHLTELLVNHKEKKIYILDNLSTGHKSLINKKTEFIKGDIKNLKFLKKTINKKNIDTIIHLAALLNVSEAEKKKNKYKNNNINGTRNLILSCKGSNVKNFIFSSSCSVYGNVKGSVNELRKLNPQGYYARTKYECEKLIKKYSKKFNFNYAILRYFNVAGASQSGKIGEIETSHGHLIKNIAIQLLKKKPQINIFGKDYPTKDGTCIRDYIHVSDLSEIHIKVLNYIKNKKKSLILNCGYGRGYSVLEIIKICKDIRNNLNITFTKRRKGDIAEVYSDVKKIKKLLKWKPKFNSLKKIITSAINWEKKLFYKIRKT
jgi:UDP-glucose 4-epimerase